MLTKQVVQSSANIIRITNISVGDVYKRFDESYDDRVYYGIVTGLHSDGENTMIESTEYRYQYSSLDVSYKVLKGTTNYVLFPSSPEELELTFDLAKQSKIREIEEAEEKIRKNKKLIAEIDSLLSGEKQQSLQAMSYKELTQEDYNTRKAALE